MCVVNSISCHNLRFYRVQSNKFLFFYFYTMNKCTNFFLSFSQENRIVRICEIIDLYTLYCNSTTIILNDYHYVSCIHNYAIKQCDVIIPVVKIVNFRKGRVMETDATSTFVCWHAFKYATKLNSFQHLLILESYACVF